jgi:SAM-dependent methyltransferase
MSYKEVFTNIYENYGFGSTESRSGPGSTLEETKVLREKIRSLVIEKNIKSVVDIPCGDFHWMKEIVSSFESYTGGDIVDEAIKTNNEKYSSSNINFINFDLINNPIPDADLLIVRDVIGHLPLEDGKKVIKNILKSNCKYLLSTTWAKKTDSGWEICGPNDIHRENEGVNYGRFYPVNLMSAPFNFPLPELCLEEDVRVDNFEIGNRKVLALWDLSKLKDVVIDEKIDTVMNNDLTIVTGLWDIGRNGRPFDHYLQHLNNFLDIEANLFLYIPKELEDIVWAKRSRKNTYVKIYELEDIKQMYAPFWDKTQEIRNNLEWQNQAGWLPYSPQATLEWYNPVVQSKMFLLNDVTIWNPFNTEHFIWLDAGITNTVYEKYFTENRALDKINSYLESFLFLSYPYEANNEIHGFNFDAMNRHAGKKVEYVCRGGLFGGKKEVINYANAMYYSLLQNTLNEGCMGTEESIFTLMSYIEPEKFRRYALDGNGLVVKFIQALLDDKVELEPIPDNRVYLKPKNLDTTNLKTSLYILTFNFPDQLEYTLKTYDIHNHWLTRTRRILIDNSNDPKAIETNKILCEQYGFEHIITGENLGINRGRQLAAEHFHNSDSDYYIFLEDDMGIHKPVPGTCRNGFRTYVPELYETIHKIMLKEEYDFLKLSFTEVYMDNHIQCSWYNVPQHIRTEVWPHYNRLPVQGLDPDCPHTTFNKINNLDGLMYIDGEVYYCNWPMIVSKAGNQKMFIDTKWAHPYEQTWMSYMYQETRKGNIKPAVLLASPINHNRIVYYKPEERREN